MLGWRPFNYVIKGEVPQSTVDLPPPPPHTRHVASQLGFRQGAGIRSRLSSAVRCTTMWKIRLDVLDCAHFHPGLALIVYSSACFGSTSYFVVNAGVASQAENQQVRGRINGTLRYTLKSNSHQL